MALSPRVRERLEHLLHTHDTPRRTAAAYALGVFFGFSPALGLHTVLGIVFAFGLNLNRVAVLLGVYSNLPWILIPYYTLATWLGAFLLGVKVPPGVVESTLSAFAHLSWSELRDAIASLKPVLGAFVLGSTIGATAIALVAYRVSLALIVHHRAHARRPQGSDR